MTPAKQLESFLKRYDPKIVSLARLILARLRKRLPGATELVYDNYNALVIGFGPSDRASQAIFSVVLFPRWILLYFLEGAQLPDPDRLLKGSGSRGRHIRLESPATFDDPKVQALINTTLNRAKLPVERKSRRLIIKSISAKQRPRRPS